MKETSCLIFIFLSFFNPSFSQEKSFPKEIETHIVKNIGAGLAPFTGIHSVFILKLQGLKEVSTGKKFDEVILKNTEGKIFNCVTNIIDKTTRITVDGKMDISELKTYIYSTGKEVVAPSGVEILDYQQDFQIIKD